MYTALPRAKFCTPFYSMLERSFLDGAVCRFNLRKEKKYDRENTRDIFCWYSSCYFFHQAHFLTLFSFCFGCWHVAYFWKASRGSFLNRWQQGYTTYTARYPTWIEIWQDVYDSSKQSKQSSTLEWFFVEFQIGTSVCELGKSCPFLLWFSICRHSVPPSSDGNSMHILYFLSH